eukprot:2070960-Rhodomonas_salina.1
MERDQDPESRDQKSCKVAVEIREQHASADLLELENERLEQENHLALLENCAKLIQFRNEFNQRQHTTSFDAQIIDTL